MGEGRSLRSRYKRENAEWRGRKFLAVSLVVTALSIIFFFALRLVSPKIKESAAGLKAYAGFLVQRVIDLGGMKVQTIDLSVVSMEGAKGDGAVAREKFFSHEKMLGNLRQSLSASIGQPFWLLDLDRVQSEILETGWAKEVFIRRDFPGTLRIQIEPRDPFFVAKAHKGWVVLDESGVAMFALSELPGWLADRPLLFGISSLMGTDLGVSAINRRIEFERAFISEMAEAVTELEKRLSVKVDSLEFSHQEGTEFSQFRLLWKDKSDRNFSVSLNFGMWRNRLEALQFVLSDSVSRGSSEIEVNGEFDGRWIVSGRGGRHEAK